jgi:predicted nucleotidyltransferase component of viral defense system
LYLLEGLSRVNLNFVFKGGTALMLLLDSPRRLSIDIDIIIEEHKELDKLFEEIVAQQFFTKFELQERFANSTIDKAHYKFYYKPIHQTHSQEEYILLDILFDKPTYQKINNIPISSSLLEQREKNCMFLFLPLRICLEIN